MVYELNRRENTSIIGNVIIRNKIHRNNNLLKVRSTYIDVWLIFVLTLFKIEGRGGNRPPISFSPFPTLVETFKFLPCASLKLLNLNQDSPSKKAVFLVKDL